jgi:large-conductance mechanosensitive channel
MKEAWGTIKAFMRGWGSFVFGIVNFAILLYIIYLLIRAMFF